MIQPFDPISTEYSLRFAFSVPILYVHVIHSRHGMLMANSASSHVYLFFDSSYEKRPFQILPLSKFMTVSLPVYQMVRPRESMSQDMGI